jgi:plastocyanin
MTPPSAPGPFSAPATRRTIVATGAKLAYAAPLVAASSRLGTLEAAAAVSPAGGTARVAIVDFAFEPETLRIALGTTVEWTNRGAEDHTATADDGSFDSGVLEPGQSFHHTFGTVGTFPYFCDIHEFMRATVVVA